MFFPMRTNNDQTGLNQMENLYGVNINTLFYYGNDLLAPRFLRNRKKRMWPSGQFFCSRLGEQYGEFWFGKPNFNLMKTNEYFANPNKIWRTEIRLGELSAELCCWYEGFSLNCSFLTALIRHTNEKDLCIISWYYLT